MKLRTLVASVAIAISVAMPFTVVNMVGAYVDNGFAMAKLADRQNDVQRLSDPDSDIRDMPAASASVLLIRHGVDGVDQLRHVIDVANGQLTQAQADLRLSGLHVWRASAIGFMCLAISSWARFMCARKLLGKRRAPPVPAH